ncbi:MAG: hypothetical protein UT03_C0062G0006, partial [Candidatus Moranbacteria bacterium GW2011_GWD2_38_7]
DHRRGGKPHDEGPLPGGSVGGTVGDLVHVEDECHQECNYQE